MANTFKEWVSNLGNKQFICEGITRQYKLMSISDTENNSLYPVVCNSRLVGTNAGIALDADSRYILLKTSGQMAQAQAYLEQSPATVLAMILTLARQQSGFNPSDPTQTGNMDGYFKYINQLFQCPVLINEISDSVDCTYGSDWGSTINTILSYYTGIDPTDLNIIRDSLWAIARAASSCPNTANTQNLFVQNALNVDSGYKIYMYKTIVQMVEEKKEGSGKNAPTYTTDRTYLTLFRTVFNLNCQDIASYVPILAQQTDSSLHSWLDDNSASVNPLSVKWTCEFY